MTCVDFSRNWITFHIQ